MDSCLLLIDVQKGFDSPKFGKRNNPQAEGNIARLLAIWRQLDFPIIHIQHCSKEAGSPFRPEHEGYDFKQEAAPLPNELVFQKSVNSAFIGTNLESHLKSREIKRLYIVGFTSDHCVSTSTRMAGNLGFETFLIADAAATFERRGINGEVFSAEEVQAVTLASLAGEFARIVNTDEVIKALS